MGDTVVAVAPLVTWDVKLIHKQVLKKNNLFSGGVAATLESCLMRTSDTHDRLHTDTDALILSPSLVHRLQTHRLIKAPCDLTTRLVEVAAVETVNWVREAPKAVCEVPEEV